MRTPLIDRVSGSCLVAAAVTGLAFPAAALDGPALEVRGSMGAGTMISSPQRDLGFRTGFVPDLHPGLRIADEFVLELAASSWFFPRDNGGTGRATMFGGGLRFDPRITRWLTWFVDGHAGVALTGPSNRPMGDAGIGLDVWLSHNLALGPFVRYAHVIDEGPDPNFWAAGLVATVTFADASDEPPSLGESDPDRDQRQREWERNRPQGGGDRDRDGIVNERDICPDQPMGRFPDPNDVGCPMNEKSRRSTIPSGDRDRDGDGVPDREDKCPNRAFGTNPDPMALGCPLPDKDRDGIPDISDPCPDEAGEDNSGGCPTGRRSRR